MFEIKTYNSVNREDESLSFKVFRLEDYYNKRNGEPDVPHRHNYYTVIITIEANGFHNIDFSENVLDNNQIYFVGPGQVHQVIENEKSYGFALLFSTQFLVHNNIPLSFIEDLKLFNDYGHSPPLILSENKLSKISNYCEELLDLNNSKIKFKYAALGSILKLILIECNNICGAKDDNPQIVEAGQSILKRFKEAVEKNHTFWHSTSKYATLLNITPDHLNRTIKTLIGTTAKEYIQKRLSIAAKRLLYFSDLSSKEIAFELGFNEASNFSTFFKKCTKISPTEFRNKSINS